MPSSLYVLLDANVIIEAHARGVWASLVEHVTLVIPSIVLQEAQRYKDPASGRSVPIELAAAVHAGRVQIMSANIDQIDRLRSRFDRVFIERIDRGEAEALALLLDGALPDHRFCTGDGPAIRALSLLAMPDVGISLQHVLKSIGFERTLAHQYSDDFFQRQLQQGSEEFVRGEGLRKFADGDQSSKRKPHHRGGH